MNFIQAIAENGGNLRIPRDQAGAHAALRFYGALKAGTATLREHGQMARLCPCAAPEPRKPA